MRRFPAIVVFLLLVVALGAAVEAAQLRIEVAVDLVNVNFSATDNNGRMITGLTAEDFVVEEDGRVQKIALFTRERELPLTLALLIDISPSVVPVFEEEKRAASGFLRSVLGPRDLASVIAFNSHVTLIQDFTVDLNFLTSAVRELEATGTGTSMFDAVYLAANEKLAHETGRRAIVLITDGEDTTSHYSESKAVIAVHRSDTSIYSISIGPNSKVLRHLSEETGGAFFRIRRSGDFEEIFEQIANELRTQYSIGYHSTNPTRDGSFRKIKIVPKDSRVTVRARRGYYAAKDPIAN